MSESLNCTIKIKNTIMRILLLFSWIFLASCCREEAKNPFECIDCINCISMGTNADYHTEPFKNGYTIQFPAGYTGDGLQITPKVSFLKTNSLGIEFIYDYTSTAYPDDYFGQKLQNPIPEILLSASQLINGDLVHKKEFCLGNQIEAIFYYSSPSYSSSSGQLFLKHKDWYYEGLNISFPTISFDEVIEVLKTIRKQ